MCYNPKLALVNMNAYMKLGENLNFILKILSGNEIMINR